MRLKTFAAPTTAEAMEIVRRELGDDAIIVSVQSAVDGQGARVTAAIEQPEIDGLGIDAASEEAGLDGDAEVRQALAYHGVPPRLAERLAAASGVYAETGALMALAGGLDALFRFLPIADAPPRRPLVLVGPPGAGKTITTAKLAARARLAGRPVVVATTDTRRAGGVEQLQAFTRILEVELLTGETPAALAEALDPGAQPADAAVFVDTAGANPLSDADVELTAAHARACGGEPILVLPAGSDPLESADAAQVFAGLGATRLLATRLDISRRLGGLLAAADGPHLAFSDVSVTPNVGDGLSAINPVSLARLLLPHAAQAASDPPLASRAAP